MFFYNQIKYNLIIIFFICLIKEGSCIKRSPVLTFKDVEIEAQQEKKLKFQEKFRSIIYPCHPENRAISNLTKNRINQIIENHASKVLEISFLLADIDANQSDYKTKSQAIFNIKILIDGIETLMSNFFSISEINPGIPESVSSSESLFLNECDEVHSELLALARKIYNLEKEQQPRMSSCPK